MPRKSIRAPALPAFSSVRKSAPISERSAKLTWSCSAALTCSTAKPGSFSQNLEMRGDVQFIDQRSVGSKLLGTFITDLYGARLTASYAGALISLEFTETTDGTGNPESLR